MLEKIEKVKVYWATPLIFSIDDIGEKIKEEVERKNPFLEIYFPKTNSQNPKEIYKHCIKGTDECHVIVGDLNDFRGLEPDSGTIWELSRVHSTGKIVLGYKQKKEDPIKRHKNPVFNKKYGYIDKNGFFIEPHSDRNLIISNSLDEMFYGDYNGVWNQIIDYIRENILNHYRYWDPLIGSRILPQNSSEVKEHLSNNLIVDATLFAPFINSKVFRRLREVKQLGALFWEFPGATHTRYEHSIMTFEYTKRMLPNFDFSKRDIIHVQAYSLLHDIGHTPYSHELEEVVLKNQDEIAIEYINRDLVKELKECGLDKDVLISFFRKKKKYPLHQIVSHKVIGTDKLAYLVKDGEATGMGSFGNVDNIIKNVIYSKGVFGIDEVISHDLLTQIQQYQMMYLHTYQGPKSRLNQRIFTLLGQIALESGTLPDDWYKYNDLWYDFFNISAEEQGNIFLKKLGREGIVADAYRCVGSFILEDAVLMEDSTVPRKIIVDNKWYHDFIKWYPTSKRRDIENEVCRKLGLEQLDILIETGGNPRKISVPDVAVFSKHGTEIHMLLQDIYPDSKKSLERNALLGTQAVRVYSCYPEQVTERLDEIKRIIDSKIRNV